MAEDGRSLGVTLVAAASTFALFVVTSLPPVRSSFKWHRADLLRFAGEFLDNLSVVAFLPISPFITMLVKVMYVLSLRRKFFQKSQRQLDVDYVATMIFCRIFIELRPRPADTASNLSSSPASAPLSPWLRCTHLPIQSYNPGDWEEGEHIDKERVFSHDAVESFDPLELCFATSDDTIYAAQRHAGHFYLELHSEDRHTRDMVGVMRAECCRCLAGEKGVLKALMQKMARLIQWPLEQQFKEREALIFALEYQVPSDMEKMKLDFVRDKGRSVFPNIMRALQAMGYMWSVLERRVQQEPISPVEAILTFLSILVALQVLMELYACARYSRVLVLRLSQQEYTDFFKAYKDENRRHLAKFYFKTAQVIVAAVVGVVGIPFFYQAFLLRRRCHLCFLSGLLFVLAPIVSILDHYMNYSIFNLLQDVRRSNGRIPRAPFLVSLGLVFLTYATYFLSVTCVILALIGTVREWKLFNTPTPHIFYSWILPHISS